jgi:hypothetical protein
VKDAAGDKLQALAGTPVGQAKVREWMDGHGLKAVAEEIFIRGDSYAAQRQQAVAALGL